ncbi:MAG: hypothetical protein K0U64_12785 [Actinomycetia bacterium]|nr:hypothetical protein [Actinomycetes bacterium]
MNITAAQPSNDHPDSGTRITPVFHALDPVERTAGQIIVLRGIIDTTKSLFGQQDQLGVEDTTPKEVREAAAKTACLTFSQIDNIVDEMSRWSATDTEHMSALRGLLSAETLRARHEASRARTEESLIQLTMTPFLQQRGMLFQRNDGKYIAVNNDQTFMSVGNSPQEAIDQFNIDFLMPTKSKPKKKRAAPRKKPKDGPETA